MEQIRVEASVTYDVLIGNNLLERSGELIKDKVGLCRAFIITDDNVEKLYLEKVKDSLEKSGFKTDKFVFKNGEDSKNAQTLISIVEAMAEKRYTRSDIIVALGGGVVGDTAGFAAASYLRGIRFVQIPTTFLAAIDSSVGGKTAVNLKAGKNLWGAFHQPSLVICDTDTLKTLRPEIFLDGVAEAVKYAVLKDESICTLIKTDLESAIKKCIEIKRDIVAEDEYDKGTRQLLNLGHTLGHSIESLSNYKTTHGHAVAIGMVLASRGGEKMGITEKGVTEKLVNTLEEFGLPTQCPYTSHELAQHALGDKKRDGDSITLVIPEKFGKCLLHKVPVSELFVFAGE